MNNCGTGIGAVFDGREESTGPIPLVMHLVGSHVLIFLSQPDDQIFARRLDDFFGDRLQIVDLQDALYLHQQAVNGGRVVMDPKTTIRMIDTHSIGSASGLS